MEEAGSEHPHPEPSEVAEEPVGNLTSKVQDATLNDPLQDLQANLKTCFEEVMAAVLGEQTYENERAQEWRTQIMQECSQKIKTYVESKYKYSLTVMVFEKTGYNRALSTVLTRKDGMVNAEYRGPNIYGLVDAVLVQL